MTEERVILAELLEKAGDGDLQHRPRGRIHQRSFTDKLETAGVRISMAGSWSRGGGGRTVTLKVKFANFQVITRSRTGQMQIRTRGELEELGNALLEPLFPVAKGIRLLGISLSSLAAEEAEREPEFSLPA
jgi:nucleotidyltransferase/DNA polymerase involved in DNA repair